MLDQTFDLGGVTYYRFKSDRVWYTSDSAYAYIFVAYRNDVSISAYITEQDYNAAIQRWTK